MVRFGFPHVIYNVHCFNFGCQAFWHKRTTQFLSTLSNSLTHVTQIFQKRAKFAQAPHTHTLCYYAIAVRKIIPDCQTAAHINDILICVLWWGE